MKKRARIFCTCPVLIAPTFKICNNCFKICKICMGEGLNIDEKMKIFLINFGVLDNVLYICTAKTVEYSTIFAVEH